MVDKSLPIRSLPFKALLLALLLALLFTGIAHAVIQNRKISGEMIDDGDVWNFRISPDGLYVVFLADARSDGQYELFSVPNIGGQRVLLSTGLSAFDGVVDFKISPDSQYVIYYVGSGCINPDQLFSVPIGGGEPVELYHTGAANYYLSDAKIAPDSSRVLFREINEDIRRDFLLSIPIRGGEVSTIYEPNDYCYIDYEITPNSQHVIFNVRESGCDFQGFFQSDLTGGIPIWLDANYVEEFKITPDSSYIIFSQRTDSADRELFSVPVNGGATEPLNGTLPAGGNVYDYEISPNSEYVVYIADEFIFGMKMLYRAPVDGEEERYNLTPWSMVPGGDVTSFQISPDSTWLVYRADQTVDDQFDLYSIPLEGPWEPEDPFVRLTKLMNPDGDVVEFLYRITPNSVGVILLADFVTDYKIELFVVNKIGDFGARINADLPPDGDVIDFRISNNSLGVVYRADQEADEVFNLYLVPSIGGTLPIKINPDLVDGGDVGNPLYLFPFDITPDDKGVVYIADQEVDEMNELFITYDYQMVYLPLVVK